MGSSETDPTTPGVVFGRDPTSAQAEFLGIHSGFPFTKQGQLDLYRKLRLGDKNPESDQVVYARVLRETGGPVDDFMKIYPHISFSNKFEYFAAGPETRQRGGR